VFVIKRSLPSNKPLVHSLLPPLLLPSPVVKVEEEDLEEEEDRLIGRIRFSGDGRIGMKTIPPLIPLFLLLLFPTSCIVRVFVAASLLCFHGPTIGLLARWFSVVLLTIFLLSTFFSLKRRTECFEAEVCLAALFCALLISRRWNCSTICVCSEELDGVLEVEEAGRGDCLLALNPPTTTCIFGIVRGETARGEEEEEMEVEEMEVEVEERAPPGAVGAVCGRTGTACMVVAVVTPLSPLALAMRLSLVLMVVVVVVFVVVKQRDDESGGRGCTGSFTNDPSFGM